MAILSLLTLGALGFVFAKSKDASGGNRLRQVAPFAVGAILFFALGTFALAYLAPPRKAREITATTTTETAPSAEIADTLAGRVTVSKESQLLFGIKTQAVEVRQITSGLKTTGIVRARPDARAVVVPPVAGRIILHEGITLGASFDLPYRDESFDRVVSSLFFHHLTRENKLKTLSEVKRVLKSNGEFHIADWGLSANSLMKGSSYLIQLLDGFETTADSFNGFCPVRN